MANKSTQLRRAKKKALKESKRRKERKVLKALQTKNKIYNKIKYREVDGQSYPFISPPRDFVREYKNKKRKKGGDKNSMNNFEENFRDGGNPVVEKNRIPAVILAEGMTEDMLPQNKPQSIKPEETAPVTPEVEQNPTDEVIADESSLSEEAPIGGNGTPPSEVAEQVAEATPIDTGSAEGQDAPTV